MPLRAGLHVRLAGPRRLARGRPRVSRSPSAAARGGRVRPSRSRSSSRSCPPFSPSPPVAPVTWSPCSRREGHQLVKFVQLQVKALHACILYEQFGGHMVVLLELINRSCNILTSEICNSMLQRSSLSPPAASRGCWRRCSLLSLSAAGRPSLVDPERKEK